MINFFNSALEKLKNQNESTVEEEDQAIESIAKLFVEAASIDGEISEEEYNHIQSILINQLKLNELKAKKILEQFISESQNEIEIWSKTKEIRDLIAQQQEEKFGDTADPTKFGETITPLDVVLSKPESEWTTDDKLENNNDQKDKNVSEAAEQTVEEKKSLKEESESTASTAEKTDDESK